MHHYHSRDYLCKADKKKEEPQGGGVGTTLFLLILSAILTTVTVLMIKAYHYPLYYLIQEVQYYNPKVDYQFATGRYESKTSSIFAMGKYLDR